MCSAVSKVKLEVCYRKKKKKDEKSKSQDKDDSKGKRPEPGSTGSAAGSDDKGEEKVYYRYFRLKTDRHSLTIGRTSSNDVYIPDSGVSRMHARIEWKEHGVELCVSFR